MNAVNTPEQPEVIHPERHSPEAAPIDWELVLLALAVLVADYYAKGAGYFLGLQGLSSRAGGSAAGLVLSLCILSAFKLTPEAVGLTWRQKSGTLLVSLCCVLLMGTIGSCWGTISHFAPIGLWSLFPCIISPVVEEIAYRGVAFALLCHAFGSRGALWPVLITALCFGLVHGYVSRNSGTAYWVLRTVYIGVTGLLYGFVRTYSGSLLFPILCHAAGNTALLLTAQFEA